MQRLPWKQINHALENNAEAARISFAVQNISLSDAGTENNGGNT